MINVSWRTQQYPLSKIRVQFSSVQPLRHVWLFGTPWTAACQASLFITNYGSLLKCMCIELVMPSISSSVILFSSCLQSFPALGSFPMSQFFTSGGLAIKLKRAWYSEEKKLVGDSSLLWSVSQAFQMPFSMQRKRIFLSKTDSHPFVLFPHVVFSHP